MSEKSPHPLCKLCGASHPLGGPHSWDKPSATKEQRIAIADAVVKTKSSGGSSAVERRPSKPTVEGSTPSPRSKQQKPRSSKGRTPGREKLDAATIAASASDAGDAGSIPAMGTITKRPRGRPRLAEPKSPRAEYQRELMRKRYAAKKKAETGDTKQETK